MSLFPYSEEVLLPVAPPRRCPTCGVIKPLTSEFWYAHHRSRRQPLGGYQWRCKICQKKGWYPTVPYLKRRLRELGVRKERAQRRLTAACAAYAEAERMLAALRGGNDT